MTNYLFTIYAIEILIFAFIDNRKNILYKLINVTALAYATYITFQAYGWSFMLLLPTVCALILGGLVGGIVNGLIGNARNRSK